MGLGIARGGYKRAKQQGKAFNNTLAEDMAEAARLGLSYGVYAAYKECGYLREYEHRREEDLKRRDKVNIIESNVIGA